MEEALTKANLSSVYWADGRHELILWANDSVDNINSTNVSFTIDTTIPSIFLDSPENITYNTNTIDINYTATDNVEVDTIWYSFDSGATNTSITENASQVDFGQGSKVLVVWVNDTGNSVNLTNVTFFVDSIAPSVFLDEPQNLTYTTNLSIGLNYTTIDTNPDAVWYNLDDGTNTTLTANITFNTATGSHILYLFANDTLNNINETNVTFNINIPPTTPQRNPTAFITNFTFNGICENSTDEEGGTINYEFYVSTSSPSTTLRQNSTSTTLLLANEGNGTQYFRCRANDGISNSDFSAETIVDINTIDIFNSTVEVEPTITQGQSTDYHLNITYNNFSNYVDDVTAKIEYDGLSFDMGRVIIDSNTFRFSRTNVIIPVITTREVLFNVSIEYYNGTFATQTIGNFTQTVTAIEIGNCSVLGDEILNYTILDEETLENEIEGYNLTNTTIEVEVTLTSIDDPSIAFNYTEKNTTSKNVIICVTSGILGLTNYSLDATVSYNADDYETEYHYIQNYLQTNDSKPQNILLLDLQTIDSTSFLVTFRDEFFVPIQGAIIDLQRKYVGEGLFRSVEHGLTNIAGETVLHLVSEEVIYKFVVTKEGEVLYTSTELLALCQAVPCEIDLQAEERIVERQDWGSVDNLDFSLRLNEDEREVTLTFLTRDGSSAQMFLETNRSDAYINETVCTETLTSSSGTLTCAVPVSEGNDTYFVIVTKDDTPVTKARFNLEIKPVDIFGRTSIIMTIFLFLTLVLLVVQSAIAMIIFGIIGLIFAGYLTLFAGGSGVVVGASIIWLIIAGMIIIWKAAGRRHS